MCQAKDYDKAILYYNAAIQVDSGNAAAYRGLGNAYYYMGRKQEALAAYEKASALNPGDASLASFVQSFKTMVGAGEPSSTSASAQAGNSGLNYSTTAPYNSFELNVMLGVGLSSKLTSDAYDGIPSESADFGSGFGGGGNGFYMLDPNFGIGGQAAFFTFTHSVKVSGYYTYGYYSVGTYSGSIDSNITDLEILAMAKYKFNGTNFWPYLLGGGGLSILMTGVTANINYSNGTPIIPVSGSGNGTSNVEPMIEGGAGLAFKVSPQMNLLLEAKYAMIFVGGDNGGPGGSFSFIPINIGVNFNP